MESSGATRVKSDRSETFIMVVDKDIAGDRTKTNSDIDCCISKNVARARISDAQQAAFRSPPMLFSKGPIIADCTIKPSTR